jgi:hypothetical protein
VSPRHHVSGPGSPGESHDKVRSVLSQHLGVSDYASGLPIEVPLWPHGNRGRDVPRIGPLSGQQVSPIRPTLNQHVYRASRVNLVQRSSQNISAAKPSAASDQHDIPPGHPVPVPFDESLKLAGRVKVFLTATAEAHRLCAFLTVHERPAAGWTFFCFAPVFVALAHAVNLRIKEKLEH